MFSQSLFLASSHFRTTCDLSILLSDPELKAHLSYSTSYEFSFFIVCHKVFFTLSTSLKPEQGFQRNFFKKQIPKLLYEILFFISDGSSEYGSRARLTKVPDGS